MKKIIKDRLILLSCLLLIISCSVDGNKPEDNGNNGSSLGAPEFSKPGGTYYTKMVVTLSCSDADAVIKYTTDINQDPFKDGLVYSGPISIGEDITDTNIGKEFDMTIKAAAVKSSGEKSAVVTRTYKITGQVPVPEFVTDTDPGTNKKVLRIRLMKEQFKNNNSKIIKYVYTEDGSTPSSTNGMYLIDNGLDDTFIECGESKEYRAIAFVDQWLPSALSDYNYTGRFIRPAVTPDSGELDFRDNMLINIANNSEEDAVIYYKIFK